MYTVYILFSAKYNKTYTGLTSNITERLKSHNELGTKGFTYKYRPWIVVHTEEFSAKSDAMKREKFFKSGIGRKFKKQILINKGLISA